jgi:uncharacterized protein (DUF3084 family)
MQEALTKEKTARSAADRSLAKEKTTHHAAELTQELESTKTSLTTTHDKLTSKSDALDIAVIQEQQAKIQMKTTKEKLKAAEEKIKTQEQSLDLAQQTFSKRELFSSMVISSVVANVVAPFKNHLPDLDVEILRKDFTIDDVEREALANSAYDAAHDFVSLYDFSSLAESDDNNSLETL